MRRLRSISLIAACALLAPAAAASSASLDCKSFQIVVPYSAGAFVDALGRLLAERITRLLGKQAIVVNRPGGSTIIATVSVANAKPDGCTMLLVGVATLTTNPTFHEGKLPYDTLKDLAPISALAASPGILMMANPDLGVRDAKELVALGLKRRGTISFASAGNGSNPHLAMEVFKLKTGTDFVHVPYRGLAPATTDLLANHVQLLFSSPAGFEDLVKSGRITALGVSGPARLKALPEVPLLSDFGYGMPELDNSSTFGILTTGQTPPNVVMELSRFMQDAARDPAFTTSVNKIGLQPVGSTPGQFRDIIAREIERWAALIKRAGIQVN